MLNMETSRLLKAIADIQNDEKTFGFQGKFQSIANLYAQGNPDALNTERDALKVGLENSLLANYVQSDFKILDKLSVRGFFGEESYDQLNAILASQAHEITKKLNDFIQQRQEAINKLNQANSALAAFNLKATELTDGEYEIGFSLPIEYQNVHDLEKVLGDIRQLLAEVAAAVGEPADFKISYVNNGSIELYIQASQVLAQSFDIIVDYALKTYGCIEMIRNLKKGFDGFAKKRKIDMEGQAEAEKDEKVETLMTQMTAELKIEAPEVKTRVVLNFKKFLKHLERGVAAEVRTPHVPVPPEAPEGADKEEKARVKALKTQYDTKKQIDQRNKEIYKLQSRNFDGLDTKFLTNGLEDEEKE